MGVGLCRGRLRPALVDRAHNAGRRSQIEHGVLSAVGVWTTAVAPAKRLRPGAAAGRGTYHDSFRNPPPGGPSIRVRSGMDAQNAIDAVRHVGPGAIETREQEMQVRDCQRITDD